MDFVKIGNKHYNKSAILCVYKSEKEDYTINFVNGKAMSISEEEYNTILGIKKKKRIVEWDLSW